MELKPYKVIKNIYSSSLPKEIDNESSHTTTYRNVNIEKVSVKDEDGVETIKYKFDMEYYKKEDWLSSQIANLSTSKLDPVIDPSEDLATIIAKKSIILGNRCTEKIESGFDLEIKGEVRHFSISSFDQMNIDTQLSNILNLNMKQVAYHSDGCYCEMFDAEDFIKIAALSKAIILKEQTYVNFVITLIKSYTDVDAIVNFNYGDPLPEELIEKYNTIIMTQIKLFIEAIKFKTGFDLSEFVTAICS